MATAPLGPSLRVRAPWTAVLAPARVISPRAPEEERARATTRMLQPAFLRESLIPMGIPFSAGVPSIRISGRRGERNLLGRTSPPCVVPLPQLPPLHEWRGGTSERTC